MARNRTRLPAQPGRYGHFVGSFGMAYGAATLKHVRYVCGGIQNPVSCLASGLVLFGPKHGRPAFKWPDLAEDWCQAEIEVSTCGAETCGFLPTVYRQRLGFKRQRRRLSSRTCWRAYLGAMASANRKTAFPMSGAAKYLVKSGAGQIGPPFTKCPAPRSSVYRKRRYSRPLL